MDSESRQQFLYFGPSDRLVDVTYRLEWGRWLTQFSPTLTTANQISQVTVRGWDRRRLEPYGHGPPGRPGIEINRDQHAVATAVGEPHEVVVDEPIRTQREADNRGRDILRNQLHEMIKASGTTVGLPDLRAGRTVHITGLGPRFSGVYFITETTHTIGDDGYRTTFQARREAPCHRRRVQTSSTEAQPLVVSRASS